jgi:hypothetical protein
VPLMGMVGVYHGSMNAPLLDYRLVVRICFWGIVLVFLLVENSVGVITYFAPGQDNSFGTIEVPVDVTPVHIRALQSEGVMRDAGQLDQNDPIIQAKPSPHQAGLLEKRKLLNSALGPDRPEHKSVAGRNRKGQDTFSATDRWSSTRPGNGS